mgnify:FL=1
MEKIKVKVDWCDKNFGAVTEDDVLCGMVVATSKSYESLMIELSEAVREHVKDYCRMAKRFPSGLLAETMNLMWNWELPHCSVSANSLPPWLPYPVSLALTSNSFPIMPVGCVFPALNKEDALWMVFTVLEKSFYPLCSYCLTAYYTM